MFLKDNLAIELLGKRLSVATLQQLAKHPDYPNFEVRTVGSKGEIQIKFPNKEWVKPNEWAINHRNTIVNNLNSVVERVSMLTDIDAVLYELGFVSKERARSIVAKSVSEWTQEHEAEFQQQLDQRFEDGIRVGKRDMLSIQDMHRILSNVDSAMHRRLDEKGDVTVGMVTRAVSDGIDLLVDQRVKDATD